MTQSPHPHSDPRRRKLDLAGLVAAVCAAEPAAVLVPPWVVQKVVAARRAPGAPAALLAVPPEQSHAVRRRELLELAERDGLPLDLGAAAPERDTLILLARPDADWLAQTPADRALLHYWRLLFHARVDRAVRERLDALPRADFQRRIERIGRPAFHEAAFVLRKEHYLAADADGPEACAKFAAVFLELLHFAPALLPRYFPGVDDPRRVAALLAEDVDAAGLLEQTRLEGAADPARLAAAAAEADGAAEDDESPEPPARGRRRGRGRERARADARKRDALTADAERAAALGNNVGAAILRMKARRFAAGEVGPFHARAMRDLDALVARLQSGLALDDDLARRWRSALRPLLARAAGGWWNAEGRLLYDLQKAAVNYEREVYSVNVVEWLLDGCRRPLYRPQPGQRLVQACKALRSAARRAAKARLPRGQRAALQGLLDAAVGTAEARVRDGFHRPVAESLADGGLRPANAVERAAEQKVVGELLDMLVARGFLNLGDLRDAISRNQLKLSDLAGPRELFGRDALLRIDRRLEQRLDGVYHRGEVYLRFFQRLSAVLFGTGPGRLLTRYVILPFLGAFIVIEGVDHTLGAAVSKLTGTEHVPNRPAEVAAVTLVGLFLMAVINWPAFRAGVVRRGKNFLRAMRWLFVQFPRWLAQRPVVRAVVRSRAVAMSLRYGLKPAAFAALAWPMIPDAASPRTRGLLLATAFLFWAVLLNTPPVRALERALWHALRVTLPRVTWRILVNLFRLVTEVFERFLEDLDRALYEVDEWLRFRAGQRRSTVVLKAVLGIFWFYLAYATRFAVNLLLEPQINPIKHFPVVTVSHKIILPTQPAIAGALIRVGVGSVRANTYAAFLVTVIPGVFGFLAWELKENWKLYRANRAHALKPVRVGSHGETVPQLLLPGFHSGTVPKLFARLRRAGRQRVEEGVSVPRKEQKLADAAHHVREAVAQFVGREMLALLNRHPAWRDAPVSVGAVKLAATRIGIELACPSVGPAPAEVSFEQRGGRVLAGVDRAGWVANLSSAQADALSAALLGLYKLAGVDIVREQVQAALAPTPVRFDLRGRNELVVWPAGGAGEFEVEAVYDLSAEGAQRPRFVTNARDAALPAVEADRLLLNKVSVAWAAWVWAWEPQAGTDSTPADHGLTLPPVRVLPADVVSAEAPPTAESVLIASA